MPTKTEPTQHKQADKILRVLTTLCWLSLWLLIHWAVELCLMIREILLYLQFYRFTI